MGRLAPTEGHNRPASSAARAATWDGKRYPAAERHAPEHAYDDDRHGESHSRITRELERLIGAAD
jgi:hypothetical protein